MSEEKRDKQDRMIELLEGMLKWMKVTSIPHVKNLLLEILPSDEEKRAYHYSDGRGSREVAEFAGVGHTAVARWWKTWVRAGIAKTVKARRGKRAKRIFSLEDFGIQAPSLKEIKPDKKETEATVQVTAEEKPVQEETPEEEKS